MTRKIDMKKSQVVAYEFDDKLSKDDVEHIHDDLRKAIGENESVCLFADVRNMKGMDPKAVIEDLKLAPEYATEIKRFAVVGDEDWHKWLTKAGDKITKGEARFFSPEDDEEARNWIKN